MIGHGSMIAAMPLFEKLDMRFLDGLPTINWSCVCYKNRVLREKRGNGDGIIVVDCFVIFFTCRLKLLNCLWIDFVHF